jgi:hypothetical protein
MNQEVSELITALLPTMAIIALVVVAVAAILSARKLLPDEYRWETLFTDLLVNNLGDRK